MYYYPAARKNNKLNYHKTRSVFIFCIVLWMFSCSTQKLPELNVSFESSQAYTKGNKLVVSTGKVERVWELTSSGLLTIAFKDLTNGVQYAGETNGIGADWSYFGLIGEKTTGTLASLTAKQSNDEQFTSNHIEIIAEVDYPEVESSVKYVIWAYPDAPGIRTQIFIKGEAKKHIKLSTATKRKDIRFDVVSGKNKFDYHAATVGERHVGSTLEDDRSIELHVKGLEKKKSYKLGFTWWDFKGQGTEQDVRVTSVDGEINVNVISSARLPDYKNDQKPFETVLVDLPSETLLDGTCRIFLDKIAGDIAQVSEVFIYEKGGSDPEILNNSDERVDELKKSAPSGYALTGYMNCGERIQGEKMMTAGRVDYLPVSAINVTRTYIGYYNDTQHRNKPGTPILREEMTSQGIDHEEKVNWSNIVRMEKHGNGVLMVKESHKCVNQYGVETGEFLLDKTGIRNTGTSLFPSDISPEEYKQCWASWSILYSGSQDEAELALKQFDRLRYPVDKERDIYLQANTWGSGKNREGSKEANVLLEIGSQADLGIDIQQIDDGWQTKNWKLREDWYPEGWKNVVAKSHETGVRLGLWAAAMPVTYEALKWHYDQAGFTTYKLDFANLGNHKNMQALTGKIRSFIKYTDHKVRVNWDLTENAPRFGYFWAREYGCIYLENRKPDKPSNVVYIPYLVLRDIWHVAKYTNINKFQTSIQNIDRVNQKISDAYMHNHPYAVAIGLVGTPLFFQETHLYSSEAKDQIRPLIATYKEHREEMYDSYVFPIGNEPDNASWTGFQWYNPQKNIGYLMIFRELNNINAKNQIALRFVKNRMVKLLDIQSGEKMIENIGPQGGLNVEIENPAGFLFLQYEIDQTPLQ
ncbi:hypothetical protein FNH22_17945 [Fulvivirga sp. M361]|uniref:hypothetical protein n=1 Tax=Fulvivirga sp. M361 TaxID=2594266 RepID=UPI00117A07E8|nr:hypothetical protein [Fulvivirga sp. M361]TRX55520.1 hypothetical protein FNH22_17945 [Fulvivirga sp. M361]